VESLVKSKEGTDQRIDVIFLDISMPKTSGMQLAEALHKLKNPPAVVFVTAYSEYALEAFNVDAVDYLMKPVETDRLNRALDKVEAIVKPAPRATPRRSASPWRRAAARCSSPWTRFATSRRRTTTPASTRTATASFLPSRLRSWSRSSRRTAFFRVHRGYIVNLDHVEDVEVISSGILQLGIKGVEEKKIPVSRRRVVPLKRALGL
jgi:two-component system LytT family response regulator